MPSLEPTIILFLATAANVLVQIVNGRLPAAESDERRLRDWIPIFLVPVMIAIGASMAFYFGRDPVAGTFEGLFAGAASVGIYELGSQVPVIGRAFTSSGWFRRG